MTDVAATELVGLVGALPSSATKYDLRGNAAIFSLGVVGDVTAPTVDGFSPDDGHSASRTDAVAFDVHDETALSSVFVSVSYGGGAPEAIYEDDHFVGGYEDTSSTSVIGDGLSFDIAPAPQWKDADTVFTIVAFDSKGNKSTTTYTLVITDPPASAPYVDSFSPADGSSISKTTPVAFDVHDDTELGAVHVYVTYGSGAVELLYDGTDFLGGYAATCSTSGIGDGLSFDLGPASQWQDADTVFTIVAYAASGATSTTTYSLTVTDPPAVDTSAPVVSNPYPALGTKISADQEIGVDVTDDGPFRRVLLLVEYSDMPDEVAYDGAVFRPWYSSESSATGITGGLRFRVKRFGGWPSRPRLKVIPIDRAGREG